MKKLLLMLVVLTAALLPLACQNKYETAPVSPLPSQPTFTPTPTGTWYTSTPTSTFTPSATFTATPTASKTNTPVPGATNTFTSSPTITPSPSSTYTSVPGATNTSTSSPTYSSTPSFTHTPVPGATNTPSLTPTPTGIPTTAPTLGSTVTCLFPATAGLTLVGSSTLAHGVGYLMASQINTTSYVGIVTVSVYFQNAQGLASAALYSDNGSGAPQYLGFQSPTQTAVNGWNSFPMPAYDLPALTCWLVCQVQGTTNVVYNGSASNQTFYAPFSWADGGIFPGTFPAGGIAVMDQISMYLTYCNENTPTTTPTNPDTPTITPTYNFTAIDNITPTVTPIPPPYFQPFGNTGSDPVSAPSYVAVDGSGNVYVMDSGYSKIQIYNSSLVLQTDNIGAGIFGVSSAGIAVNSSATTILGVDSTDARLLEYSPAGVFLGDLGIHGSGNSQFADPICAAYDTSNNFYITDLLNYRVQAFNSAGSYITQWNNNGNFGFITGIAVDGGGNVYVADESNDLIDKFTTSGVLEGQWSCGQPPFGIAEPVGIAADGLGNIFVSDEAYNLILEYTNTGAFENRFGGTGTGTNQFTTPGGLAVNSAGTTVFVADTGNNRIVAFTP